MGNGVATRPRIAHDEEQDDYLLVDTRGVILGLPDDQHGSATRPPLRGALPPEFANFPARPGGERPGMTATSQSALATDVVPSESVWKRLARRVHLQFGMTRGARRV
jgi:hypothetical protein